jgi:hypothetical protein
MYNRLMPSTRVLTVLRDVFYWIGVVLAGTCVTLAFFSNSDNVWHLASTRIPFTWAAGLLAIGAFLAFELCDSTFASSTEPSRDALPQEMLGQEVLQEQEV